MMEMLQVADTVSREKNIDRDIVIEAMEEAGVVSAMNSNGSREVLAPNHDA